MKMVLRCLLFLLLLTASAHAAEFDCTGQRFRGGSPEINEVHIFCGEIRNGKGEGYHSERVQPTPNVVGVDGIRPNARHPGLYEGVVHFTDGGTHRSTFYPRNCAISQIETSIRYAARHKLFGDQGDWSFGPSAPLEGGKQYCLGLDGRAFIIQLASTPQGGVNTAFPDPR